MIAELRHRRDLAARSAWAGFFLGAGGFQVFDGLVNHKVLRIHQIRYDVENLGWQLAAAALALLLGLYMMLLVRRQLQVPRRWSRWRTASWTAGSLLIAAGISPIIGGTAEGHMAEHLLVGMYGPVLLVLTAPVTLALGAAPPRWRRRFAGLLQRRIRSPPPVCILCRCSCCT